NNPTICNEASGLSTSGVPLEVASVGRSAQPTFPPEESPGEWAGSISDLGGLRTWTVALALARAPFVFGRRFWTALLGAATCPAERLEERIQLLWHFGAATLLALRWKDRRIAHIHAHGAHTPATLAMHAAHLLGLGFSFTGHAADLFAD